MLRLGCTNAGHQIGDAACLSIYRACKSQQIQEVSADPYDASPRFSLVDKNPRIQRTVGVFLTP